jgi:beta-N-acetylhexosaminidase
MSTSLRAGVLFAAALALVAADKAEPEPKKVAPPKADVRGEVKKVTGLRAKDLVGNVLVEGSKEKDTQHDKASVTLTSKTKIYLWADGKKKDAKFTDVKEGSKVQCVFTGPVAESYPVQARASEVIILEEPKKK